MTRRRWALRALAGVLLVLFVLAATVVAAVLRGLTIDVSRWRDAAAMRLATVLERPASLHGPFTLTLGREATLHVGAVEIPAPTGFSSAEFAALGEVDVRFDLLEALHGTLAVSRIEAGSGHLRLERSADGRANWSPPRSSPASPPGELRIADVVLRNLDVDYVDPRATRPFRVAVDELTAQGCCDEPLRVALRGRTAGEAPYALTLTGGALQPLFAAAAPWPFEFVFEYADARLAAGGALDLEAEVVELSALQGRLADAEATGRLSLDWRGVRPQLRGALAFSRLNLISSPDQSAWRSAAATEARSVRELVPLDLDLRLTADELPGQVRDATVELHADDGRLHAPLYATWRGIPVSGGIDFDTAAAVPTLAVRLEAKDAALRDLPADVVDGNAVAGTLGRIALSADARGETVAALIDDLQLALSAAGRLRFERAGGAPPLALTLDALDLSVRHGERLRGRARGTLQGEQMAIAFQAGTLPDLLQRRATPIEADLTAARLRLRASGTIAFPGAGEATDLAFDLRAPRAGALAPWLPVPPAAKLALDARGHVRIDDGGWRLHAESLKVGRSTLAADASHTSRGARPVTSVAARARFLDLAELATLLPPPPRAPAHDRAGLLPEAMRSADMDVELAAERIVWRQVDVQDAGLAARLRAGRIDPSTITARMAGGRFHGVVAGDVSGATPDLDLQLFAESVDLGALLRPLGATQQLTGTVDAIEANAHVSGSTLHELVRHSSLTARARGATLSVSVGSGQTPVVAQVTEATLETRAGSPVQIRLSGSYDEEPLEFQLTTGRPEDLVADRGRIPIVATGHAADTRLDFDGDILLPLGRGGRFTVDLGGERLDRLSGLAGVELPAWGPWAIRSPVHVTAKSVDLPALSVRVGTSTLKGAGKIGLTGPRPRLALDVTAPIIQLDDFPLPERLADDPEPTLTAAGLRATARGVARRTERLLNARFLQRFNVAIDAQVKEVLSGTDRLVDGHLRIQVDDGHLYLGPARVNLPGGTLTLALAYDPKPSEIDFKVGAYVERFDYGIIARRLGRGENVRGLISAQVDIASRGQSLDRIMQHADGRVDFAIWPEELGGRIFNLWSVNLLLAVLPMIDPGGEAHVNCMVGRFDLRDGVVSDDKMLIDTTRVRVRGTGHANLRTDDIDLVFRPRAKGLALFRLQYPLRVTGTLTDYSIGIDRREIIPATLRMLASPILVPWERLTRGPLPRDGVDVCTDPMRQ